MRKRASDSAGKNGGVVDRLSTTYGHLWGKKPQTVAKPRALTSEVRDLFAADAVRAEMIETAALAAELGLVAGQLSEASLRLAGDKFLVTAASSWLHQLHDDDLLLASDADKGFAEEGLPAHWPLHLAGYRLMPQAGAALLGHPAAALALMAAGKLPDPGVLAGAEALGNFVICAAEAEQVSQAFGAARVIFVKGVGVLVFAETLQQALIDLQLVNRLSEISWYQTRGM